MGRTVISPDGKLAFTSLAFTTKETCRGQDQTEEGTPRHAAIWLAFNNNSLEHISDQKDRR